MSELNDAIEKGLSYIECERTENISPTKFQILGILEEMLRAMRSEECEYNASCCVCKNKIFVKDIHKFPSSVFYCKEHIDKNAELVKDDDPIEAVYEKYIGETFHKNSDLIPYAEDMWNAIKAHVEAKRGKE
jgi:hypothetical protein